MTSRDSVSASQRSIATYSPLNSADGGRRRTASQSIRTPSTCRSLGQSIGSTISESISGSISGGISGGISGSIRGSISRSISQDISQSVSRNPSRSISSPGISLRSGSRSSIIRSNAESHNRGTISRPSTSRSTTRHSTARRDIRSLGTQSNPRASNALSVSGLSDAGSSSTRSRNNESMTRPRTSQSNATSRVREKKALSTLGTSNDQQLICAMSESRGISPVVGLAFVNLTTSEAVLCQISDNQTYTKTMHKLWVFDPSEILFMNTAAQLTSQLHSAVENHRPRLLPRARVVTLDRKYWSETLGQEFLHTLAFKQDVEALKVSSGGNFYATCSFAAVCHRRLAVSIFFQTKLLYRSSSILSFICSFLSPFILFESNMSHLKAQ